MLLKRDKNEDKDSLDQLLYGTFLSSLIFPVAPSQILNTVSSEETQQKLKPISLMWPHVHLYRTEQSTRSINAAALLFKDAEQAASWSH